MVRRLPDPKASRKTLRFEIRGVACAGRGGQFAVLCVDRDDLKELNDVFGHATGDKLLIEVAHRVQAAARGAVVALLSGDEVGLIIDGKQP
jgi:diguanylate cyclase (GGDEF)-like protein